MPRAALNPDLTGLQINGCMSICVVYRFTNEEVKMFGHHLISEDPHRPGAEGFNMMEEFGCRIPRIFLLYREINLPISSRYQSASIVCSIFR